MRSFSARRSGTREADDATIVLGFVGRLSIEKNVALLVPVQKELERWGSRISAS